MNNTPPQEGQAKPLLENYEAPLVTSFSKSRADVLRDKGFAFSSPESLPAAPEVPYSADVKNPWHRSIKKPRSSTSPSSVGPASSQPETSPREPLVAPAKPSLSRRIMQALSLAPIEPTTATRQFEVLGTNPPFASNGIRTSKYTPLTFLPLNLYEQFHKVANIYFLVISVLQFLPVSSVQPTTWLPLSLVLVTNMVKEAVEDYRRAQMDEEINGRPVGTHPCNSPDGPAFRQATWKQVQVGDIILLKDDDAVPADVIVLATSDTNAGLCYIDTAQLDGETNLKNRESVEEIHRHLLDVLGSPQQKSNPRAGLDGLSGEQVNYLRSLRVECEHPNEDLHSFHGVIQGKDQQGEATQYAVSNKQVIYRGCTLRNTRWVYGLVVFTGMETKLMRNAMDKRLKFTTLDRLTNRYLVGVFLFLAALCIVGGLSSAFWILTHDDPTPWYLYDLGSPVATCFLNMITLLILMSLLIPISLSVSMEIVKLGHAFFISNDVQMCYTDPITKVTTPAQARTSNLSEDLGRVEYIFTDKTGTLTQNVMEYMKCSIAGVSYGSGMTEIGIAAKLRMGQHVAEEVEEERPAALRLEKGSNFYDKRISLGAWRQQPDAAAIRDFFTHLAVCHTLMVKPKNPENFNEDDMDAAVYQANSPDELALVVGAKCQGFWFKKREYKYVTVQVEGDLEPAKFEVLNVCEFNSTRKRMSVVARFPDGTLRLLCKGADSVIYERLSASALHKDAVREHMDVFANEGLRTLALSQKILTEEQYAQWNERFTAALTSPSNREQLLDDAAEEIETDLQLLGATAIEDKLQVGVPTCLATLARANIQIWVLTGDKVETAINIALACNLFTSQMELIQVTLRDPEPVPRDQIQAQKNDRRMQVLRIIKRLLEEVPTYNAAGKETALVIDGYALTFALEAENIQMPGPLCDLSAMCKAVVCCRVSPKQKAEVVELIRTKRNVVTLAIGDGANDVGMIMKAHIGVGISGNEGMQAVLASDYSIAQFRFLQQLLLIHGRWDVQRVSIMILYFFYKNVCFASVSLWYGTLAGWSGVKFWNDYYQSLWNVIFTAFPIFAISLFNKDMVTKAVLHRFPELYKECQLGQDFKPDRFFAWAADGVWCSLVVLFVPMIIFTSGATEPSGLVEGKWLVSFTVFCCCHTLCNLRLALITRSWPKPTAVILLISLLSFYVFSAVFCVLPQKLSTEFYGMFTRALGNNCFWASLFLSQVLGLIAPIVNLCWSKMFNLSMSTAVARLEYFAIKQLKEEGKITAEDMYSKENLIADRVAAMYHKEYVEGGNVRQRHRGQSQPGIQMRQIA
eukprot:TRINITY_DN12775_c0_g2_i1.p1 TRINITY_DN12775_c0_g2~~TRINITY_DN12775_c0_g2_i1.p1  ORF type:complete len:1309 (-),score=248.66 TRINITY_DN12775_c0_g2_i1:349-4275(-)